jgi:hypothetical protein
LSQKRGVRKPGLLDTDPLDQSNEIFQGEALTKTDIETDENPG